MIILNAGIPRSGTILVNAIIRQILTASGRDFESLNFHGRRLAESLSRAAAMQTDFVHIFHMHDWSDGCYLALKSSARPILCLANRRDPRDVCVSLMRLHDNPLDYTIGLLDDLVSQHMAMLRDRQAHVIRYESDVADSAGLVAMIASALDATLTDDQVAAIVAATSIGVHRKVMQDVAGNDGDEVRLIRNRRRTLREHRDLHINDRHIQSGASGRWQSELTAPQQAHLTQALSRSLIALGYGAAPDAAEANPRTAESA